MSKQPLNIKNLTKYYGPDLGVKDISLELKPGEVFGFLGPNGAGKSTTIRTILDFIHPTEGSINVYELDSVVDSVAIKHHVGYLAGDIALYERMTGRQILKHLTALGKETDWKYVDQLVERLDASLDRPIEQLSKGNVQKIGLIQAFMHKPDLLVLDEPTSGLDPLMKQVFYDMVHEMSDAGKTVFVSSHDLTEVQKICDRAAFISSGKLVGTENIADAEGLNLRRYRATFNEAPDITLFEKLEDVKEVEIQNNQLVATITGSVAPFIAELAKHNPTDLDEQETNLEDLFMHYYEQENKDA